MTQLEARTLAEAYLFVELVLGRDNPVDLRRITSLSHVEGHRVLQVNGRHDGVQHDFTIVVPIEGDPEDVRPGETYGTGRDPSILIDAGQWRGVEAYSTNCIAAILQQAGGGGLTSEALDELSDHLDTAYSALAEIGKFLPEGADEVPASAFWSDSGRLTRERQPEAFRRERLVRDEAEYRSMAGQIAAFDAAAGG